MCLDTLDREPQASASAGSVAVEVFERLGEDPDGAEQLAREILRRETDSEPEVRAHALLAFGWCRLCKGASADAIAYADEALMLLDGSVDRHLRARAYQLLSGAHHAEGEHAAGFRASRHAARLHEAPPMRAAEHAEKMKAVARLGGGFAHDIKNMLAAIVGYSDLAMEQVEPDSPANRSLANIIKAAAHARQLIREIMLFTRRVERKLGVVRLQPVLREAMDIVRPRLGDRVEIREAMDAAAGPVRADNLQMHRVAVNLMANACEAMAKNGGVLTVVLEEVDVGSDMIASLPNLEPGRHVVIRVADTGVGMEPDVARRIFEPYFTTRVRGQGHGLGLNVAQSLVLAHGGEITVESYPGIGSTMSVYLRRALGR